MIEVGQPVAIAAAVATGGEPIKQRQHVAVEEQERRTHEALDGLDGSAKKRYRRDDAPPELTWRRARSPYCPSAAARQRRSRTGGEHDGLYGNAFAETGMKAGVALGFSNEPPETSTEALPTTRRELGTPLPAGNTPAKLASAPRPPAPVGPRAESTEPEWLAIAAELMYASSDSSSDGASEAAAEAGVDLTSWQDAPQALAPIVEETAGGIAALAPSGAGAVRELAAADAVTTGASATLAHTQPCRDGANGFIAAARWAFNAVVRHMQPVIIGFLLTYLAYLVAAHAVSTADTITRVVPGFAVPCVSASHGLNWLHNSEAYLAGAGAAHELGVSTPIGPLAAMASSRRALLLPAAWASPAAQLHSSSCAFPASSMSPGGRTKSCLTRSTVLQSKPQFRFNSIFYSSGRGAPLPACTALANHVTHAPCEFQGTTRARFRSHTPIATCFSLPSMATLRKGHRGGERCAGVVLWCLSSRQVVVQVWGASTRSQRAQNAKIRSLRGSASTDEGANALGDTNEGRGTAPLTRDVASSLHEVAGHARH